jgi:VWFA-related protein
MKIAVAFASCLLASAQDVEFDAQSRLVIVPATVTDAKGRTVDGLTETDFALLDNGRPRKVTVDSIATGVAPVALVVAVQAAGISGPALAKVQKIGAMLQPLITGERGKAAIVSFAEGIEWRQDFTNDPDRLQRAFAELRPRGERTARMLDAVHEAVARLRSIPNVRRVLLLISESRDRGSETELQSVVTTAEAAGVAVYAATYSAYATAFTAKPDEVPQATGGADIIGAVGELVRRGKTNDAELLASRTGGIVMKFARQKGLEDALGRLGDELHSQYVLSFTPEPAEAGHHSLEVRLTRPGNFRVRARPGYWSAATFTPRRNPE